MNIKAEDLGFRYGKAPVLTGISLEVGEEEILALVGPNGSGKTTLLKNISGVLKPQHGAVYLDFKELPSLSPREIARQLAAVEQEVHLGFDFTVREIVELGRLPHLKRLELTGRKDHEVVGRVLQLTDTAPFADRSIRALSSGQRQRVWLAMALAQEPKALLLDEPTAHLDINYQIEIMEIIKGLAFKGIAVLMAVHDLNLAAAYAHRIALLHEGQIAAIGKPQEVLTEGLIETVFKARVRIFKNGEGSFYIGLMPKQEVMEVKR
jgi:iron complex transport system ATP-binding protein